MLELLLWPVATMFDKVFNKLRTFVWWALLIIPGVFLGRGSFLFHLALFVFLYIIGLLAYYPLYQGEKYAPINTAICVGFCGIVCGILINHLMALFIHIF